METPSLRAARALMEKFSIIGNVDDTCCSGECDNPLIEEATDKEIASVIDKSCKVERMATLLLSMSFCLNAIIERGCVFSREEAKNLKRNIDEIVTPESL